jgi:FAD/FMN-containing dehydrogenase
MLQTTARQDLVNEFVQACAAQVRGEVRADMITRALYATDASNYQIEPLAVIISRDRDGVIAAMALAARFQLPLPPRGSRGSAGSQQAHAPADRP